MPSYEDLISGRLAAHDDPHDRARRPAGARPGRARQRGPRASGSATASRMVTGAGGSIGAELCRQIARFRPAKLVLFDLSEAALYEIQMALADAFPQLPVAAVVGDVKHAALVDEVLARERPSVIFHAGRLQARAADGGDQRVAGGAQQRLRDLGARARGDRGQGREVRARLDRQGGQSDQRDGRDQAPRRDRLPEPAGRRHAVRARALRQRVRQRRQRDPALLASRSRAAAR